MKKILLVEDNREIAEIIFDYLELEGITVDYADNGMLGLQLAQKEQFDVIILDLMLPRLDGLSVCNQLRDEGNTTLTLMLTALDSREDMLDGFEHGADDYLTKPFDLDILFARLKALSRRSSGQLATTKIQYGEVSIDVKTRRAYRSDRLLALNPTTYKILALLCQKAPDVVTRQQIFDLLWEDEEPNPTVLRSHIYQLRNQLDKPFDYPILTTLPKVGFRLESGQ